MRAFSGAPIALTVALTLGATSTILTSAGCSQVGVIQARRAAKAANQAYARQDYRKAAEQYDEAIEADPNLGYAYFYLGNSYDQQFEPSRRARPRTTRCSKRRSRTTRPASRSSTPSRTTRTSCSPAGASSISRRSTAPTS